MIRPFDTITAFRRDSTGIAGVEFALVLPLLLLLVLSSATFFDYFLQRQAVERSLHTVGDYVSRQTSIDQSRIDWMQALMADMVRSRSGDLSLRFTNFENRDHRIGQRWQRAAGEPWQFEDFDHEKLPNIPDGDSAIVIEVVVPYRVPFGGAFEFGNIESYAIYRPRFIASIPFS